MGSGVGMGMGSDIGGMGSGICCSKPRIGGGISNEFCKERMREKGLGSGNTHSQQRL